ncbi:MAG: hypothetical protein EAZ89_07915, partial [Bacteroidetes bacterium]
ETEIPANDYIDIGIFGKEKINGKWEPKTLYLQRHHIQSDSLVLSVQVREKPTEAGIDPLHKLIDRKPDDNIRRITLNP